MAKHFLRDTPIKRKLTFIILLTSAVALLLACGAFVTYEQVAFRTTMVRDFSITAEMIGFNSAAALSFNDADAAAQTLKGLSAQPHVVAACIYDNKGNVFATYQRDSATIVKWPPAQAPGQYFGSDSLELFRPIIIAGESVGGIYLRSDLDEMRQRLVRYALIAAGVMSAATLIALLIGSKLQRLISEPIADLVAIASRIAVEKDYSARAVRRGNDELGHLIDGFNHMLAQIAVRDAELEKRVAERTQELQKQISERNAVAQALQASEGFLHSLLDNLPVFIYRQDREGRFTFANKLYCQQKGSSLEDILGKSNVDLGPPDIMEKQWEQSRRVMDTGVTYEGIEESVGQDGEKGFIHIIKVPLYDAARACIGLQSMFLDVTEQKRAEASLAEASGLLNAMLENSPDLIYFKDRESRFVRFSNAFALRINSLDPKLLRGKTDFDLYQEEHARPAYNDDQAIITTGRAIIGKLEKEVYTDGRVGWVLTTKMPWRDGSGNIIGTFGISKEVTALVETETKLAYERDLLRVLLDASPDGIYFKDLQSRFVRVSKSQALRALAHLPALKEKVDTREKTEADTLTGLSDFDIYTERDAQLALEDEQQIIRTGEPIIGKIENQHFLDDSSAWSLSNKMPWRDRDGNIIGTFGVSKDISDLKRAEEQLEQVHRQLLETSRQAGMAEVATSVLHNVGNVLNSVNISATLVSDLVRTSKAANIGKVSALFLEHEADLVTFLSQDPRGRQIPGYLRSLADHLSKEHGSVQKELESLRKNIDHIKDVVATQQTYAKISGVTETVSLTDLVEDSLRMNAGSFVRHDVSIVRNYLAEPTITVEKHKVLQILVNLIRNAKYACDESGRAEKKITVEISEVNSHARVAVIDNGVGIPPENLTLIFSHGFTTRKEGHGFGLHSGALAAKNLGGSLKAFSEGMGKGATFILELPYQNETKGE